MLRLPSTGVKHKFQKWMADSVFVSRASVSNPNHPCHKLRLLRFARESMSYKTWHGRYQIKLTSTHCM